MNLKGHCAEAERHGIDFDTKFVFFIFIKYFNKKYEINFIVI